MKNTQILRNGYVFSNHISQKKKQYVLVRTKIENGKDTTKKTISQLMAEHLVSFFFSGYSQLSLLSNGSKNSSLNFLEDQDSTEPTILDKPDSSSKSA